ncbi:MAG: helix-turn-helix domain-containing protein [Acidobacteriaceae bacterium]
MKTLKEMIQAQPAGSRRKIAKRVSQLISEEMTMRELRKARKITQAELAKALGVKQEQVSRSEKRADIHLSTLKRSVEAMGGSLTLVAEFPNSAPVKLSGFTDLTV